MVTVGKWERRQDTGILWATNILSMVVRPAAEAVGWADTRLNSLLWAIDEVYGGFEAKYGPERPAAPEVRLR